MTLVIRARHLAAALSAAGVLAFAAPVLAQDISASHLKAARAAVDSIDATDQFDMILPQAATALKAELIQKNPDMQQVIQQIVDEKTLALVGRRADLEKEAASIYARKFTEEELNAVATFYNSAAGQKLLVEGPGVARELIQSAEIWQRGVARDLAQSVGEELTKYAAKNAPVSPAPATAQDGVAPKAN